MARRRPTDGTPVAPRHGVEDELELGGGVRTGLLLSSSRAILYASAGDDFADAARAVAVATRDAINAAAAADPVSANRPDRGDRG